MDPMITHLNIMLDGLKRKEKALSEILNITENQQTVIRSELPLDGVRELFLEMNEGKQEAIQVVKDCDNMFEAMLKEMGQDLEARQDMFQPQVKEMQEHIRRVMDLDVKIRVTEEENNRYLDERRGIEPQKPQEPIAKNIPEQKSVNLPPPSNMPPPPQTPNKGIKPKVNMPTDSKKIIKAYEQGSKNYKG